MTRRIRAVYNDNSIRVYQAYNNTIANEAIENGKFGLNFKRDRMTWIKPSFLWMMYRSGWGTKDNQERILAIDIKRDAFDYLVKNAVPSTFASEKFTSVEEWKQAVKESLVRVQWDPERDVYGNPLEYRSIQIGIRGELVNKYVDEWIVKITDLTEYVGELKLMLTDKKDISEYLPQEQVYTIQ